MGGRLWGCTESDTTEVTPSLPHEHLGDTIRVMGLGHTLSCLPVLVTDAGRDWGQEEKGTTEDEMAGWHQ